MRIPLQLLTVLTALVVVPLSYAQFDLNGNGTIDLPLTLVDGEQLRWFGQDLTTDEVFHLGLFGHPDYQVNIGYWSDPTIPTRVFVAKNEFGDFELHAENRTTDYQLGQSHDDSTVIIGRDIDSSGLLDAVLINRERSKWAWKFSFNPLSTFSNKRRILYGRKSDIPFLFRSRGQSDSLGLLKVRGRRSKISYRALRGKRKRRIRLKGFTSPAQQPLLIRGSNGRDGFGFVEGQRLITTNSRGRKNTVDFIIPQNGSILVGDFDSDGEESLVTFSEGKIIFADGETKRLSDENVQPLASKSEKSYQSNDVSPVITATPVPTRTIIILPTNTTAPTQTVQPTYTPFPTVTPFPTASHTSSPTVTFTAIPTNTITVTPTATQTYTSIPTQTPQPTYTAYPTTTSVPTQTPQFTYTPFPTFTFTFTPTATGTPTPIPTPVITGTPPVNSVIRTDCNAHLSAGETTDGVYWVDPDGSDVGLDPMRAYCDMTTDSGGWTLILNYLHQDGTSPSNTFRNADLPLQSSSPLGSDESGTEFWGHATTSLIDKQSFSEVRFYCVTSESPSRLLHFKSSLSNLVTYIKTGVGDASGINTSFSPFAGHNANLPATATSFSSNKGHYSLVINPFQKNNQGRNWEVGLASDFDSSWKCDSDGRQHTHHQVWIR